MELLNPAEFRNRAILTVDIGGGRCVRAKRLDMSALVFEGLVPMPMLAAVQRMIAMPGEDAVTKLASLDDSDKQGMLTMLRKHVVRSVIEPVLTLEDDGNSNHLPVDLLPIETLLRIWNATAIEQLVAPAEAAEFRPIRGEPVAPVLPAREDVPHGTESLDFSTGPTERLPERTADIVHA